MTAPVVFDITPAVTESLAVWPGDTPLQREVLLDMKRGDNLTLSTLRGTVHLGAHVDGPNHYGRDADGIDVRALDYYLGSCQVMHVEIPPKTRLTVNQLAGDVTEKRILFATGSYPDPNCFNEDFSALDPSLIDHLHAEGVILIGIDTPSVDLFESKNLPSHEAFLRNDMAILEGVVLDAVPDGIYELIALPLKLVGFDASPVRAILRG